MFHGETTISSNGYGHLALLMKFTVPLQVACCSITKCRLGHTCYMFHEEMRSTHALANLHIQQCNVDGLIQTSMFAQIENKGSLNFFTMSNIILIKYRHLSPENG